VHLEGLSAESSGRSAVLAIFNTDFGFYVIMALFVALPLFLFVAAVRKLGLAAAQAQTLDFLDSWSKVVPGGVRDWLARTMGLFGGFFFLIVLAYVLNSVGMLALPLASGAMGHFGNDRTTWYVERFDQWRSFEETYVLHATRENPQFDWWEKRHELGMGFVRGCRILTLASVLLIAAGILDLFTARFRRRGAAAGLLGLLFLVLFVFLWTDKASHYMVRVQRANLALRSPAPVSPELASLFPLSLESPGQPAPAP